MNLQITLEGVGKRFGNRSVLKNISMTLNAPMSLAITGKNGVGKTTLLKIIAGLLSPTEGTVTYMRDDRIMDEGELSQSLGFVAPYLELYDELTAEENLRFLSRIRSGMYDQEHAQELLSLFQLEKQKGDIVGSFSSGMKQRLKYVFALLHRPTILLVDEPTVNLDSEGIDIVKHCLISQRNYGIVVLATTLPEEAQWCTSILSLDRDVN